MNKILHLCLVTLAAVGFTLATLAGVNSCTEGGLGAYIKGPSIDATDLEMSVENILVPQMTSVDEVIAYHISQAEKARFDSVFMSMSDEQIRAVSTVLLKTNSCITVPEIVNEYLHPTILNYNNLPDKPDASKQETSPTNDPPIAEVKLVKEENTTVTEAPPTRVDKPTQTSSVSKDTTIDGKRATVTTTIQKYE